MVAKIVVINEHIALKTIAYLEGRGYSVVRFPSGTDDKIMLKYAKQQDAMIMTADEDLGKRATNAGIKVVLTPQQYCKKEYILKYLASQGI